MPPRPPEQQSQPAPQVGDPAIKLQKFVGLVNTVGMEALKSDEFWRAVNVDIDDAGRVRRRRGYTQVSTTPTHSLYTSESGVVYGVCNGILSVIHPDYSTIPLLVGVGDDYASGGLGLDYAQVGTDIYFSGTSASGIIRTETNVVDAWGPVEDFWLSPVVNPTVTLPAIRGKLLGSPPRASFLTAYNGRIYCAQGNTVWATELFLYTLVDKTRNFMQFEGDVTMLGTVGDGLYVGTTEGLWFLAGPAFPLKRVRVMDSPIIPRSMTYVPAELANPPQVGLDADTPLEVSIMFQSSRGVCVAMDSGKAMNLTESKFIFPEALRSAAVFRRQDGLNQYIAVNDSAGQPQSGAAIGDYVDATIIRAK